MGKRVLVVGSGGREHALAWKIAQSELVGAVWVAPGNVGIDADPAIRACVPVQADDLDGLADFAQENRVDLTVIGPEAPLCAGIVDLFEARGLPVFGPSKAAAKLEGSKAFSKDVMQEAGVLTADFKVYNNLQAALDYVTMAKHPLVIKADGLAGGKGVVISHGVAQSHKILEKFMVGAMFGESSATVLIEDFLVGPELSFMVVTDGSVVLPLATSRDHKRLGEGDTGPNTGGMGAITPSPDTSPELERAIIRDVIEPVLAKMRERGTPFSGFLYAGLMLTADGPYVLEFNVRLGDPETQPLLYALESDLAKILFACVSGELEDVTPVRTGAACAVVMASPGYPTSPKTGQMISGLGADLPGHSKVFYAGVARNEAGELVTKGGRVLAVTSEGEDCAQARERAYQGVANIGWTGAVVRRDIGR